MRGIDGKLCYSEQERGNVWNDYIKRIMHSDNNCVSREELV